MLLIFFFPRPLLKGLTRIYTTSVPTGEKCHIVADMRHFVIRCHSAHFSTKAFTRSVYSFLWSR